MLMVRQEMLKQLIYGGVEDGIIQMFLLLQLNLLLDHTKS
jgi:hypothetical protein